MGGDASLGHTNLLAKRCKARKRQEVTLPKLLGVVISKDHTPSPRFEPLNGQQISVGQQISYFVQLWKAYDSILEKVLLDAHERPNYSYACQAYPSSKLWFPTQITIDR